MTDEVIGPLRRRMIEDMAITVDLLFTSVGAQARTRAIGVVLRGSARDQSLNKALHPKLPANRARIITRESDEAARFYTARVIRVVVGPRRMFLRVRLAAKATVAAEN